MSLDIEKLILIKYLLNKNYKANSKSKLKFPFGIKNYKSLTLNL